MNTWTGQAGRHRVIKCSVASSGFIKSMSTSAVSCDSRKSSVTNLLFFHKCTVRNSGLRNLSKAGAWVTSWIQIFCPQFLCSSHFPTLDPRGLHDLPQLKEIQLFKHGSQSSSSCFWWWETVLLLSVETVSVPEWSACTLSRHAQGTLGSVPFYVQPLGEKISYLKYGGLSGLTNNLKQLLAFTTLQRKEESNKSNVSFKLWGKLKPCMVY